MHIDLNHAIRRSRFCVVVTELFGYVSQCALIFNAEIGACGVTP
jgi:hypothetical protein